MKILVLCYEYPPVGGGGGRVAAQIAAALVRRGHAVHVITAGLKHLPHYEKQEGVEIFRPPTFRQREDTCTVPEMGLYLLCSLLPAWRHIRRWQPDVIHAHFAVPTGALAFAMHRLTGVPYVLTAHLGDVPGGVPEQTDHLFRMLGPVIRPIWKSAAATTAVSRFVGNLAEKAYGIHPFIIPNGIKYHSASLPPLCKTRRIVMVGRLSIQKNPLLAIEALARLGDEDWHCDVIGEGPLGEEMRNLAAGKGLREKITFHGWLPSEAVARIMASSDILLMTSLHEGLPMVAIEALQHGLAIIGSDIGGMLDVVENGKTGFLCALTSEAFSEKLRFLIDHPDVLSEMKKNSLLKAGDFDLELISIRYEEVLMTESLSKKD